MKISLLFSVLLITTGFTFWKNKGGLISSDKIMEKIKEDNGDKKDQEPASPQIKIMEKWELPSDLKEVSGIAYIDDQRFACIQDEKGSIFIFNRTSKKIEKEIPFTGSGDFEGIAVKGTIAYAVRSDGRIYEIDMGSEKNSVKEYKTDLTRKHDIEGLCYDSNNNRLLLAIKAEEPGSPGYKGIYAFDLSNKSFIKEPAFKIDLGHEVFTTVPGKKKKSIMPSDISIHPQTNDIYITEGSSSRLLIMDKSGKIKKLYQLGKDFNQPEGITFSPQGELFIANEGGKQPADILKVEIQE